MTDNKKIINIAMIMDNKFIAPSITAIKSIIDSKFKDNLLNIYIFAVDIPQDIKNEYLKFNTKNISIAFIDCSVDKYLNIHTFDPKKHCVASISALLKFDLPNLLPKLDKVLYLDGDIIVKKDLSELYANDVSGFYVAAVRDSGRMYYRMEHTKDIIGYFNSGVMLLNLAAMRKDNLTDKLISTKKSMNDNSLMDQDVFNIVMQGHVKLLEVKYNFLVLNLLRAKSKWNIKDINDFYNTSYNSFTEILDNAVVLHFSSKEKPYNYSNTIFSRYWLKYFKSVNFSYPLPIQNQSLDADNKLIAKGNYSIQTFEKIYLRPSVSLIVCAFNAEKYIETTIKSLIDQTQKDIEIIIVNDGSKDNTLNIIKHYQKLDNRIKLINNKKNVGVSISRNIALEKASGEYFEFVDADDYIDKNTALKLYEKSTKNNLDMCFFKGIDFNDGTNELVENDYYSLKYYPSDFKKDVFNYNDCIPFIHRLAVSTCLTFYNLDFINKFKIRFPNIKKMHFEDNYFFVKAFLKAERVSKVDKILYFRRLHSDSITHNWNILFNDFLYIVKQILVHLRKINVNPKIYNNYAYSFLTSAINRYNSFGKQDKCKYYSKINNLLQEFGYEYSVDYNYSILRLTQNQNYPFNLYKPEPVFCGIRRGFSYISYDFLYKTILGIQKSEKSTSIVALNKEIFVSRIDDNSNQLVKLFGISLLKKVTSKFYTIYKLPFIKIKRVNFRKLINHIDTNQTSTDARYLDFLCNNQREVLSKLNQINENQIINSSSDLSEVFKKLKTDDMSFESLKFSLFSNLNLLVDSNREVLEKVVLNANNNDYYYKTICSLKPNSAYSLSFILGAVDNFTSSCSSFDIYLYDSTTSKFLRLSKLDINNNYPKKYLNFTVEGEMEHAINLILYVGERGKTKNNRCTFEKILIHRVNLNSVNQC